MKSGVVGAEISNRLLRLRVLVVEDSWNVANSIKSILDGAGATVLGPVPSVAAALDLIRNEAVSVALVNMNLREAFADDVVSELLVRRIPYVIVTASETLPMNSDKHAAGVVSKPVDAQELIDMVARFVAG
jgi:DNA-binding NtrC family response regulator